MYTLFSAVSKTLDISVTSAASTSTALPAQGTTLRVVNEGPNVAFLHISSGTAAATLPATSSPVATCTPVMPGDTSLSIPGDAVYNISAVTRASQTARLSVSVGEGC